MKFERVYGDMDIDNGMAIPWWRGIAWRDNGWCYSVTYPKPLHWIVRAVRHIRDQHEARQMRRLDLTTPEREYLDLTREIFTGLTQWERKAQQALKRYEAERQEAIVRRAMEERQDE